MPEDPPEDKRDQMRGINRVQASIEADPDAFWNRFGIALGLYVVQKLRRRLAPAEKMAKRYRDMSASASRLAESLEATSELGIENSVILRGFGIEAEVVAEVLRRLECAANDDARSLLMGIAGVEKRED
jgi:hypothetical protein